MRKFFEEIIESICWFCSDMTKKEKALFITIFTVLIVMVILQIFIVSQTGDTGKSTHHNGPKVIPMGRRMMIIP